MRILFVLAVIGAAAAPARADEPIVSSYVGLELGLGPSLHGDLGARFHGGAGGGFTMGMRLGRFGVDFAYTGAAITDDARPVEGASRTQLMPSVALYLVDAGPVHVAAHAGFGWATIAEPTTVQVMCPVADECPGGTRGSDSEIDSPGYALDGGVRVEFVAPGHGVQHAMLWVSVDAARIAHQVDGAAMSGTLTQLAFGIALAIR